MQFLRDYEPVGVVIELSPDVVQPNINALLQQTTSDFRVAMDDIDTIPWENWVLAGNIPGVMDSLFMNVRAIQKAVGKEMTSLAKSIVLESKQFWLYMNNVVSRNRSHLESWKRIRSVTEMLDTKLGTDNKDLQMYFTRKITGSYLALLTKIQQTLFHIFILGHHVAYAVLEQLVTAEEDRTALQALFLTLLAPNEIYSRCDGIYYRLPDTVIQLGKQFGQLYGACISKADAEQVQLSSPPEWIPVYDLFPNVLTPQFQLWYSHALSGSYNVACLAWVDSLLFAGDVLGRVFQSFLEEIDDTLAPLYRTGQRSPFVLATLAPSNSAGQKLTAEFHQTLQESFEKRWTTVDGVALQTVAAELLTSLYLGYECNQTKLAAFYGQALGTEDLVGWTSLVSNISTILEQEIMEQFVGEEKIGGNGTPKEKEKRLKQLARRRELQQRIVIDYIQQRVLERGQYSNDEMEELINQMRDSIEQYIAKGKLDADTNLMSPDNVLVLSDIVRNVTQGKLNAEVREAIVRYLLLTREMEALETELMKVERFRRVISAGTILMLSGGAVYFYLNGFASQVIQEPSIVMDTDYATNLVSRLWSSAKILWTRKVSLKQTLNPQEWYSTLEGILNGNILSEWFYGAKLLYMLKTVGTLGLLGKPVFIVAWSAANTVTIPLAELIATRNFAWTAESLETHLERLKEISTTQAQSFVGIATSLVQSLWKNFTSGLFTTSAAATNAIAGNYAGAAGMLMSSALSDPTDPRSTLANAYAQFQNQQLPNTLQGVSQFMHSHLPPPDPTIPQQQMLRYRGQRQLPALRMRQEEEEEEEEEEDSEVIIYKPKLYEPD